MIPLKFGLRAFLRFFSSPWENEISHLTSRLLIFKRRNIFRYCLFRQTYRFPEIEFLFHQNAKIEQIINFEVSNIIIEMWCLKSEMPYFPMVFR